MSSIAAHIRSLPPVERRLSVFLTLRDRGKHALLMVDNAGVRHVACHTVPIRHGCATQVRHAAQQCLEALFNGLGSSHRDMRAFWSSEAGVQDLAYVTQLLLEAADAEARAGHTGSKAVRTTAVATVCLVLEAVRDPAPLSYLLPGLVGGLSKALLAGDHILL